MLAGCYMAQTQMTKTYSFDDGNFADPDRNNGIALGIKMTHRVIVNTSDGQTAAVFQGDETSCNNAIKQLPGKPLFDQTGKEVGTIVKAWVEENVTE